MQVRAPTRSCCFLNFPALSKKFEIFKSLSKKFDIFSKNLFRDAENFFRHQCELVLRHQMQVSNYFVKFFYSVTKCQSLNGLLALHRLHTQVNIFGYTFLHLLIKLIMLLYILYCPPTPNLWLQGSFNPWPYYHQSSLPPSPPPPQPHRMSAKIGVECSNHITFSA
jgi:hypothetical protein